jgi:ferredoxin
MHAKMFECGNCLKVCNVDAADQRDFYSGRCPLKLRPLVFPGLSMKKEPTADDSIREERG